MTEHQQRQQDRARMWNSEAKAFRRWLVSVCTDHNLPPHRLEVSRNYKVNSKAIQIVNTATNAIVITGTGAIGQGFNREAIVLAMVATHHGINEEEAEQRIAESQLIPEPESHVERPRDPVEWVRKSKSWKVAVNAANRDLESVCKIHNLPLVRLKVPRKVSDRYNVSVIYAETGEPISESIIPRGFELERDGAEFDHNEMWHPHEWREPFKPEQIAFGLMVEQAAGTDRDAVYRQYETERLRAKEIYAERMDFNRWKPNYAALQVAKIAHERGTTEMRSLRAMYTGRWDKFRHDTTHYEKHALVNTPEFTADREWFKSMPLEFRKMIYRCYKGGVILETATLEELNRRLQIKAETKERGGNSHYRRKSRLERMKKKQQTPNNGELERLGWDDLEEVVQARIAGARGSQRANRKSQNRSVPRRSSPGPYILGCPAEIEGGPHRGSRIPLARYRALFSRWDDPEADSQAEGREHRHFWSGMAHVPPHIPFALG